MVVILVAGTFAGCTGRRFVVGGGHAGGWTQRDAKTSEDSEQFVETQPPLVDESEQQAVANAADEPRLPRELPPPVDAVAATASVSPPARLKPAETAQPAPTADVAVDSARQLEAPEPVAEVDDVAASPIRTVSSNTTHPVRNSPPANQPDTSVNTESAPVRALSEAQLDREFAELRTLRDSLKQSYEKTSNSTKSTTQSAMRGSVEEMLDQLAEQMAQLTKSPATPRQALPSSDNIVLEKQWQSLPGTALQPKVDASVHPLPQNIQQASHDNTATVPAPDDLLGIGRHLLERGLTRDAEAAFRGAARLAATDADRALATYLMGLSQIRGNRRGSAEVSFKAVTRMSDASLAALAHWQLKEMVPRIKRQP